MPALDPGNLADLDQEIDERLDTQTNEESAPEAPAQPDTPEADEPAVPTPNYEKRYKDLQSEFTRRAQRDAERDEQLRAMQAELARVQASPPTPVYEDEDDEEYYEDEPVYTRPGPNVDPTQAAAAIRRLEALEAREAAREQRDEAISAEAEDHGYIDEELDAFEEATGRKLSERASKWIGREALENRDPLTGKPDVEAAVADWYAELEAQKKEWVSGKRSGTKPPAGPGAVEVPDLDDPEALEEYIDSKMG